MKTALPSHGCVVALYLTWLAAMPLGLGCGTEPRDSINESGGFALFEDERAPELGPDDFPIGGIRIIVTTGTENGAGTHHRVSLWVNNRRYPIDASAPDDSFEPGGSVASVLSGPGVPRDLGQLRRSSLVLALELGHAAIGASWFCAGAVIEVRPVSEATYHPYLVRTDVGWLSMGEPPRLSPFYALQ